MNTQDKVIHSQFRARCKELPKEKIVINRMTKLLIAQHERLQEEDEECEQERDDVPRTENKIVQWSQKFIQELQEDENVANMDPDELRKLKTLSDTKGRR